MTTQEFSTQFDVLYNNITSSQAPGLDEYEKSVFLTKAQLEVVKNHLNQQGNKYKEGIDGSPKRQVEFSALVKDLTLTNFTTDGVHCINGLRWSPTSGGTTPGGITPSNPGSLNASSGSSESFDYDDILAILNENVKITRGNRSAPSYLVVIPLSSQEYDTLMSRPFKRPPRSQAWRMFVDGVPELIVGLGDSIVGYNIRYVGMPKPIILTAIGTMSGSTFSGLKIDGYYEQTECELPVVLHEEILQRAVELAKAFYVGDANQTQLVTTMGERSE